VDKALVGGLSPALFFLLVGSLFMAFVGSVHDQALIMVLAASSAALAAAAISVSILRTDSRLAAEEAVALGLPIGEALHSFERSGRSALLVFIRADRLGRIVEAFAYDPDDDED
jgi:hypothetical protein